MRRKPKDGLNFIDQIPIPVLKRRDWRKDDDVGGSKLADRSFRAAGRGFRAAGGGFGAAGGGFGAAGGGFETAGGGFGAAGGGFGAAGGVFEAAGGGFGAAGGGFEAAGGGFEAAGGGFVKGQDRSLATTFVAPHMWQISVKNSDMKLSWPCCLADKGGEILNMADKIGLWAV